MRKANKDKYYKGSVDNHKKSKGWFVGHFMGKYGFPLLETDEVEVCWKVLKKGFCDKLHYHKRGVEIAIIIKGWYGGLVNGKKYRVKEKEFMVVYPESQVDVTEFQPGTELVLIKAPSAPNDKYEV